jgi:hypothetical protein
LLFERAIKDGLIDETGREALANRLFGLEEDGYVRGEFISVQQANGQQRLAMGRNLQLTMKAYPAREPGPAPAVNVAIYGSVVNSQVALGDITTYNTFVEVLDRAYEEIGTLADVDEDTKEEARCLIDRLRGRSVQAVAGVATGAAGVLVAQILARLVGLG